MTFTPEDADRVADLARLRLTPSERDRLAADVDAITRTFGGLAAYARDLPDVEEAHAGALRDDVAAPPDAREARAILQAAPRVDAPTGKVKAARGLP